MRRTGRQTTRIITVTIIYTMIVVKPINSPKKMKVIIVAAYRIYLEEFFQQLLFSLNKRVI